MNRAVGLVFVLLVGLGACGRRSGIYADRSVPVVAPAASDEAAPRFVGRWAASAAQCLDPWVFKAASLSSDATDCAFDKVEASPAGYAITAVCRSGSGPKPARLVITTPNKAQISLLTISGGPFRHAEPLQRCAAP